MSDGTPVSIMAAVIEIRRLRARIKRLEEMLGPAVAVETYWEKQRIPPPDTQRRDR